jgi:dihydrofolate reductase
MCPSTSQSHTLPIPSGRPQVSLHALITLDGYVADPALEHTADHWQRLDIDQFSQYMLSRSNALILGRPTYESIIKQSEWPYLDHQAHVLTRRQGLILNSSFLKTCHDPLDALLSRLNQDQVARVWLVGGHRLVIGAMALGLIDELIIHMLPFAQGQGQSFFDAPDLPDFALLDVQRLDGGIARMHYQVS